MSTDSGVLVLAAGGGVPEGLADACESSGGRVCVLDLEVTDPEERRRKLAGHLAEAGTPQAMINLLHSRHPGVRPESVTNTQLRGAFDGELTRTLVNCQEVGRAMIEAGGGTIVFVLAGVPDDPLSNVVDDAAIGLMRVLGVEWAGAGVRVVAVSPTGPPGPARDAAVDATVAFLISADAAYVTGTTVPVHAAAASVAEARR